MTTAISGTRTITSHAVGVVFVQVMQSGEVRFDRMDYTKRGRTSVRHIMETGEGEETVRDTLASSFHEAAKDKDDFKYEIVGNQPILVEFGDCERVKGGTHMKVFFMVNTKSPLRDFILPDGDETLGSITMVEAKELLLQTEGKTVAVHVRATRAALGKLARISAVFSQYRVFFGGYAALELTPEQKEMVDAYPGKW